MRIYERYDLTEEKRIQKPLSLWWESRLELALQTRPSRPPLFDDVRLEFLGLGSESSSATESAGTKLFRSLK